ncbi:MAG: RES family NAD+ phosphorylase [Kiloniellales bacterium]
MIHDPTLLEQLSAFATERFDGEAFRATRASLDPLAPSTSGGRWAPVGDARHQIPILYTSLEREGALAETSYHWGQLTPRPSKVAVIHRIRVTTGRTLRLLRADLERLGVNMAEFAGRDHRRTQEIGAAVAFLDRDGLIVPSARWHCDNLVIFTENHELSNDLAVTESEEVDWQTWAYEAGLLRDDD